MLFSFEIAFISISTQLVAARTGKLKSAGIQSYVSVLYMRQHSGPLFSGSVCRKGKAKTHCHSLLQTNTCKKAIHVVT